MNESALSVNSNVMIKLIDKYGRTQRTINVHNKANQQLVLGLLRFMSGDFNKTYFNDSNSSVFNSAADQYIPVELSFGTIGVKMTDRDTEKPKLDTIDYSQMKKPAFDEDRLQEEIISSLLTDSSLQPRNSFNLSFDDISITSFDDPNNSMALKLRKFIPAGKLVGQKSGDDSRKHYTHYDFPDDIGIDEGWVYFNEASNEYSALFTEIGLYARTGEGKRFLLARVLFDGKTIISDDGEVTFDDDNYTNNPVIQTDTTSVLVEWRIGIVSIGQNDKVVSGSNLRNFGVTDEEKDLYAAIGRIYATLHPEDYDEIYAAYMEALKELNSGDEEEN